MNVLLICGGQSPEHEISIKSARNVACGVSACSYSLSIVVIARDGSWGLCQSVEQLQKMPSCDTFSEVGIEVSLVRHLQSCYLQGDSFQQRIDCVFPMLHGPNGEDGAIQGMMQLLGVPYVGCDAESSMLAMDKDLSKKLIASVGLPVTRSVTLYKPIPWSEAVDQLCDDLFVKPAHMGSSVGISRVRSAAEWDNACVTAFSYGRKIIIEESFPGKELECAVLGYKVPRASHVAEIKVKGEWYDYAAKYLCDDGAEIALPAELPVPISAKICQYAIEVFELCGCEGMARVDFFYHDTRGIVINEINTIPGFTDISLYPQLWQYEGVSMESLVQQLIEGAVERYQENKLAGSCWDFLQ